jgi:hypothetical protein
MLLPAWSVTRRIADKKELSVALAAVEGHLMTPAGKQYDTEIGRQFPQKYAAAIKQCKQSTPSNSLSPFDIFLKLKGDARVEEVLAYPETAIAVCTRESLSTAQFTSPPRGEYWINIHLELRK